MLKGRFPHVELMMKVLASVSLPLLIVAAAPASVGTPEPLPIPVMRVALASPAQLLGPLTGTTAAAGPILPAQAPGDIVLASASSAGVEANAPTQLECLSADGRYVLFATTASNLVPGDTNGVPDVFVKDLVTGATERVSVATDGTQTNNFSSIGAISGDGRYVVFTSYATNLVTPATSVGRGHLYLRDRVAGTTQLLFTAQGGAEPDGSAYCQSMSSDGRWIVFQSTSTNLVPDDTNGATDIFIYDRQTGQIERVSVASDGTQSNGPSQRASVSDDGRWIVFDSDATNLVPSDTNGKADVFLHDRAAGQTRLVSVSSGGVQGNSRSWIPWISGDGRFVVFESASYNLVDGDTNGSTDIFLYTIATSTLQIVSKDYYGHPSNNSSSRPAISGNGRIIVFGSLATDLVPNDTNGQIDIFAYDRLTGRTSMVTHAAGGGQANGASGWAQTNGDGTKVSFASVATNLVPGGTSGQWQIFVAGLAVGGDFNGDGLVTAPDLLAFIQAWRAHAAGQAWDHTADINRDGDLTEDDADLMLNAYLAE